jgi:hypothetical protein
MFPSALFGILSFLNQMSINDTESETSHLQAFSAWLFQQRQGALHSELTIALAEVTQAVMDTDKAGSVTLTVTIKKAGRGIQMIVSDNITTKIPKAEVDPSFFFFDEETCSLTRNDPYQPDLPLQSLPPRRGMNELKEA